MSTPSYANEAVSLNPSNGQELARYPYQSPAELEAALRGVQNGFEQWRDVSVADRAEILKKMAVALRTNKDALARMEAVEMGKPISQGRAEVEKTANLCEWYAENGPAMLAPQPTSVEDNKAFVAYRPLGAVLAVMPWNFPVWQILRGAVPAILSGNPYVLKHAPNVMGCAYLLKETWTQAGLPAGIFEVINVDNAGVSTAINDPRIASIAVTGSTRAGAAIAAQAGAALKKCVLELGGSDPFIVLADADLDEAVAAATVGRFQNTGQICIAAKRIIVERGIAQAFEEKFKAKVAELEVGDSLSETTYIGPMARYDLRDELDGQVQATISEGARLVLGGKKMPGDGNFYEPTILADVKQGMTSFVQEVFGPVASIIVADDADHAIELANDSEFGLSGTLWSGDSQRAKELASRIVSGGVFINGYTASDPRVPIGGVKKSGFGRELSHFGLHEFCNIQTVWFDRR
ncbi:succinate dehydrogenase [Pseudomonas amygdali pv. tabaci str. ATCC 11528]|uniref:aldehyde dehydrogenase family protein n=3 Tax=Pseudomonas amygdali TaxID=47877 RepID=UPI000209855F|nr:aldehyde dehydrogenase family protein [Pseudomonas amygdali]KKY51333.1 succinate dehydrogenase [Pseudomonas amygdali pv. tabaci str. ATCC 11528]QED84827.1 aldehyde dehydrogenase family protein [Pseudomonas amygdali pv. tabaci str. ATCC 11528]